MMPVLSPTQARENYSVDELYDFFDFFDHSVEDVYAYILHRTRAPAKVEEMTLDVFTALLQRRKFFFWKSPAHLSTALGLADKAIAALPPPVEAEETAYFQELLRCRGGKDQENAEKQMRTFLTAFRSLPLREQRMAVLQFFLHWDTSKTAGITHQPKESIATEYTAIKDLLCNALLKDSAVTEKSACEMLTVFFCPVLRETKKKSLRMTLLERCQAAPQSSLRFALPVGAMLLVFSTIGATFFTPSLSGQSAIRSIAAAEVLLMDHERQYEKTLTEVESDLKGIAAHYGGKEVASVSVDLAPKAVAHYLTQNAAVHAILDVLKVKSLQTAGLPVLPRAYAAEEELESSR